MKIILLIMLVSLVACKDKEPSTAKTNQSKKAQEVANSINFSENAEIDNIKKRLELTSAPELIGYIALINGVGQVVWYGSVKGKITSSGKRLTRPQELVRGDNGAHYGDFLMNSASDEGTWGHSSPYIYFWTASGQYIQWNGLYTYSNQPFRLTQKPILISKNNKK